MPNIFSSSDLQELKDTIGIIVQDISINTILKYRQYSGNSVYYNPEDQVRPDLYTDWSGVSAIKGIIRQNEIKNREGIELGDTKYVFMQSSVSGALSTSDLVVESGNTYNVVKRSYDDLGLVNIIFCRLA